MLLTNPWKPLGRFLTDEECAHLMVWLSASLGRFLILDCVYDFGTPSHRTTLTLLKTGKAILLHSVTKGWLWPKTFGVALICGDHPHLESAFRNAPPSQEQLNLAARLMLIEKDLPARIVSTLCAQKKKLLAALPGPVKESFLSNPNDLAPGCYFFASNFQADELLGQYGILAVPASAFGAHWNGSVLTSLAEPFARKEENGGIQ
jgi:aspartate/methionine/tyrosine aminotransferase